MLFSPRESHAIQKCENSDLMERRRQQHIRDKIFFCVTILYRTVKLLFDQLRIVCKIVLNSCRNHAPLYIIDLAYCVYFAFMLNNQTFLLRNKTHVFFIPIVHSGIHYCVILWFLRGPIPTNKMGAPLSLYATNSLGCNQVLLFSSLSNIFYDKNPKESGCC